MIRFFPRTTEGWFLVIAAVGAVIVAIRAPDQMWREAAIPAALLLGVVLGRRSRR